MKTRGSKLLPPAVACVALLIHATLMYQAALRHTKGAISYPVDDAYIHLALAKQIAQAGVYGVTPHEFSAASSSIGWPLVLAFAIKVAGAKAWLPLALNALFAVAMFFAVDRAVRLVAPAASVVSRSLIGLAVMILTPMATLVILGMEHTAHAAATVVFITTAALWLEDESADAKTSLRRALTIAAWAGATTLWRYEGIFPVAIVVTMALARKRARPAIVIALGGALPIVLFGIYSKAHGAHFLPTPVLLKGRHLDLQNLTALGDLLGGDLIDRFGTEGYALAVAVGAAAFAWFLIRREGFWRANGLALLITLGTVLLHLELASVGWFFRYESYLLVTGLAFLGATLARLLPSPGELWTLARTERVRVAVALAGIIILSAPLWRRAMAANDNTPMACRNIHEQQMQTARFLAEQFPHQPVAVNDIGAVAWLDNDRVVDLVGLASLAVAEAKHMKLETAMSREDLVRLTKGVKVAVIYDEWFTENLPPTWLRVARWRIADNKSCAFPTVSIYATDPEQYPAVIEAVRAFAPKLPPRVLGDGRATDHPLDAQALRAGDRVLVETSSPEATGTYTVFPDGVLVIRGLGPVAVRGLSATSAAPEVQALVDALSKKKLEGTKIERVTRVAPVAPVVFVTGAVTSTGEIPGGPLTLDAACRSAGVTPAGDAAAAWVWREKPTGFVKLARAELVDGALTEGDLVVVPRNDARAH